MSSFLNSVLRSPLHYNLRLLTPLRNFNLSFVHHLYSPASLGIDNYVQSRKRIKEQFANFSDKFRSKMSEFVTDPKNMIFTEDLKNMVHIAEPTDLQLVVNMIKKFNTQNSEYRFGSFIFGPVVMRMFHFLDAPNEALKCFEDPANEGFFDQQVSYQTLLDLLYTHEMYEDMYKVFEKVKEKQINMTKYPKYSVVLILAACYKQNTPKSMEYASKLWSEMMVVGANPLRRAATLFAGLALKQGAPHIALETISQQKQHYVTVRNIKAVALADAGRPEDALPVLRQVLDTDRPSTGAATGAATGTDNKHTFFAETISRVRVAIENKGNKDLLKEFDDIEKALRERGLIDDQTLDVLLNSEIKAQPKFDQQRGTFQYQPKRITPMKYSHRHRGSPV